VTSLGDFLTALAPHLPPALLPPNQMRELAARLSDLPGELTSHFGLECRLHDDSQVDVQCAIKRNGAGHHLLMEGPWPALWRMHPLWQQLQRFARRWYTGESPAISHIWLGFDLARPHPLLLPLIHLRTDKVERDGILPLVEQVREASLPGALARTARHCLDAAPVPTYIGLLTAREATALRWTLPLPLTEVRGFLDEVGWPGDLPRVIRILDAAGAWTTHVGLSLNIGEQVEPYLGLEFLNWTKPPSGTAAWRACLETLIRWNYCTVDKAHALLRYPGISHEREEHWPPCLSTSPAYRERMVRMLSRNLLHIKIALPATAPPHAKAYLAARHGWIQRQAARPQGVRAGTGAGEEAAT
jgi:hypothetical protein